MNRMQKMFRTASRGGRHAQGFALNYRARRIVNDMEQLYPMNYKRQRESLAQSLAYAEEYWCNKMHYAETPWQSVMRLFRFHVLGEIH